MSTEFNELLPDFGDDQGNSPSSSEKIQVWLIGSREQIQHNINEFYVKRIITDRSQFSPVVPAPFSPGKYMSVLLR